MTGPTNVVVKILGVLDNSIQRPHIIVLRTNYTADATAKSICSPSAFVDNTFVNNGIDIASIVINGVTVLRHLIVLFFGDFLADILDVDLQSAVFRVEFGDVFDGDADGRRRSLLMLLLQLGNVAVDRIQVLLSGTQLTQQLLVTSTLMDNEGCNASFKIFEQKYLFP